MQQCISNNHVLHDIADISDPSPTVDVLLRRCTLHLWCRVYHVLEKAGFSELHARPAVPMIYVCVRRPWFAAVELFHACSAELERIQQGHHNHTELNYSSRMMPQSLPISASR